MKVFISYASKDEPLATELVQSLEESGLDAWYDKREVLPGDNWAEKISEGLKQSTAMVVLLTPEALESKDVQSSISYAISDKSFRQRLIPVIVGDSKDLPQERFPWILKHLQTINLSKDGNNDRQFKRIAQVIKDAA